MFMGLYVYGSGPDSLGTGLVFPPSTAFHAYVHGIIVTRPGLDYFRTGPIFPGYKMVPSLRPEQTKG